MPWRGPPKCRASDSGSSTSTSSTSGNNELLPNSMFMSWPGSVPTDSSLRANVASALPSGCCSTARTRATTSRSTRSSSTPSAGISMLCSRASASARWRASPAGTLSR